MRHIKIEKLSQEAFAPFGTYFDPKDCGPALGGEGGSVQFYPDQIIALFEHSNLVAVSPLVIAPRELNISMTEMHLHMTVM
jgi:ureidoglycolate hydrolase